MIRPRRSVLYMPANNSRALEKARQLPADCIIIDLEDAVAPVAKVDARYKAVEAVRAGGFGSRELAIRINPEGSPWFAEDLAAVVRSGVNAVVLPKVESAATVQHVADQLPEGIAVWAMIETPRGVMRVDEIALAHARLKVLVMGTSDLAKELRVPHRPDRLGFLYALSRCVVAARVAGIDVIDGVYLDLADHQGFAAICEQGKALGFDGKSLIHPEQLAVANEVFAPSTLEIEKAKRVLRAWREAEAAGSGVSVLDGKLVENLHADEAARLLALAAAIGQH